MNARQFFDKVVEMRRLQKEYFKSRSHLTLEKSKAVEREIDQEIKRVQDIEAANRPPEPNLFNQ
ncbi:hypothetical protein IMSAGC004_03509 [Bacteroidaceae bacterium]|uniref:hypothetical protein n=1 Tax=Muribaculum sp. NM65_B17 TaxID=2516961 RepID=UPI001093F88A|nr:hypothetical protein [Muribaculum sp. NM65_B17]TGY03745.1 hypothetical protein E5354_09655 [Muribaculum sp. NM65_B17]THG42382.1 hypothetical protein E5985_09720 [Muribaculaceae bacterium]GFI01098.1 hypothetical protein IMSAGC004_03509 [Bacteroidaceae bacterium]GFI68138.1 hypothetical protein IMSAG192_01679 [Muribaculaceae bacterium]